MPSKPQFVGEKVKLGDLCDVCSGGTPKRSVSEYWNEGSIPWVKISDISSKFVSSTEELISEAGLKGSSAKLLAPGTLLYSIFASIGAVGILKIPAATNQAIAGLSIKTDRIERDYLYHFLKSQEMLAKSAGRGVAQNNINLTILRGMEIPVPAIEEQKAIVEQLEMIAAQIKQAETQLVQLDSLVKSRFVEMFLSSSWPIATIGECSTDIRYGTSEKASAEGEYVYLRMNNMGDDGALNLSDTKRITLEGKALSNCLVRKGDLLFNRTNSREKVGKTCVFCFDEPMVIAGYIIRVRLDDRVDSVYLAAYMNLNSTKALLRGMAKGAVHQANINAKQLASIEFPLADIDVQKQFASFVSQVDKSRFLPQSAFHHRERPKHPSSPRARGCLHEAEQRSIDRGINKRANSEPCNIASSLGTVGLKHVHKTMSSRRNLAINN